MAEELLEKIPAETCWEITAKALWRFIVLRGDKIFAPGLGKEDGWIAPVLGAEKWAELANKVMADGAKLMFPQIKEMFNIPVEDAVGAAKLVWVAATLFCGPEILSAGVIIESTPERVVLRVNKCPTWEMYNECEVDPAFRPSCDKGGCQAYFEGGLKAINPKITYSVTKAFGWGDPNCESVIEFKEE